MRAPKRSAAGTGRTTPPGTRPDRPTASAADGHSAGQGRTEAFTPKGRHQQVRQSQYRPLPQRRGARGNR
jgi:hypothetical protein